ncbi:unknown protein [Seminavis robusta]|uniref:Uncharacterized protein n=1 Tax=Seminavis robusta TaxID=568900 RepID=A0A9N8H3E9_9STRA|nr:unknown protein [Seminavis robusta]|eukprot:Sro59_g033990.1 n/a (323) ;mRNA; r:5057-6123
MMSTAGSYAVFMANRAADRREDEERERQEQARAVVDNRSFFKASNTMWDCIQLKRNLEFNLRHRQGVEAEKIDWLVDKIGGLGRNHLFETWFGGPNITGYDGYPFPMKRKDWLSCDREPKWGDETSNSRDPILTNKDVIFVMFNKMITDGDLLTCFCAAMHRSGGNWKYWRFIHRFMSCFGVATLGNGDWETYEEYRLTHFDGIGSDAEPSEYDLHGTIQDLTGVDDEEQALEELIVEEIETAGVETARIETQPREPNANAADVASMDHVRLELEETFDSVHAKAEEVAVKVEDNGDVEDDDGDKKPAAKKRKNPPRRCRND